MRPLKRFVAEVAREFPASSGIWAGEFGNPMSNVMVSRTTFDVELVLGKLPAKPTVVDLGGGMGVFATVAAAQGARSVLVDDMADYREGPHWETLRAIWARYGVQVEVRDLMIDGLGGLDKVDAITAFHLIEHLHHSPRAMLHDAVSRLGSGGKLVIAVPNAANLRKRITVPLCGSPPTPLGHWYDDPVYRGHVREPVAADLVHIASDLGLVGTIIGRNFLGLASHPRISRVLDPVLQRWPSLCSDLYLVATKP